MSLIYIYSRADENYFFKKKKSSGRSSREKTLIHHSRDLIKKKKGGLSKQTPLFNYIDAPVSLLIHTRPPLKKVQLRYLRNQTGTFVFSCFLPPKSYVFHGKVFF